MRYSSGQTNRLIERQTRRKTHSSQYPTPLLGRIKTHPHQLTVEAIDVAVISFLPLSRYASATIRSVSICPSVCHMPVLYRNGCTYRADFWLLDFSRLILHQVLKKLGYLQNKDTSLWNFVRRSGLIGKFDHGTSSDAECDKQAIVVSLLLTTADMVKCQQPSTAIVVCWSHSASRSVCNKNNGRLGRWARCKSSRGSLGVNASWIHRTCCWRHMLSVKMSRDRCCDVAGDGHGHQVVHRVHQVTAGRLWTLWSLSADTRDVSGWRHSPVSVYSWLTRWRRSYKEHSLTSEHMTFVAASLHCSEIEILWYTA